MNQDLFAKYDIPVPRYTSYPTVPYWSESPSTEQWMDSIQRALYEPDASWSMYVHVPYCETLCTFCGCNTVITKDHKREFPYVDLLLKEWNIYLKRIEALPVKPLKQLHLGGGTPTFLSPEALEVLFQGLFSSLKTQEDFVGSIEVDPRRTSREQLKILRKFGFTRVSMGVQDFDPEVQRLVNRVQPIDVTESLTQASRDLGFNSVNFDLIYGLPKQTLSSIQKTMEETIRLRPDRIALYSFALVPWIKPAQRLFKDEDLPKGKEKRNLYELARQLLNNAGYKEIGMDHFALASDELYKSVENKKIHRNFMGYTESRTDLLLGLGVSAISETPTCFHQNEKVLNVFERRVQAGEIPTFRGHLLSGEDQKGREKILRLITAFEVELSGEEEAADVAQFLGELIEDGLVSIQDKNLVLTEAGRPFLRNACMAFDKRLREKQPSARIFSQSL